MSNRDDGPLLAALAVTVFAVLLPLCLLLVVAAVLDGRSAGTAFGDVDARLDRLESAVGVEEGE